MARISLAASAISKINSWIASYLNLYQIVGRGLVRGRWMFFSYPSPVWRKQWNRRCSWDRMVPALQLPSPGDVHKHFDLLSDYCQGLNSNWNIIYLSMSCMENYDVTVMYWYCPFHFLWSKIDRCDRSTFILSLLPINVTFMGKCLFTFTFFQKYFFLLI